MDIYDDIELVRLALDGDTKAFAHLVKRHYMSVYMASYKWCGIKEDAEEITHEVFIKLAQTLKTFRQKSPFKTWLYRISINTAKDFQRKHATKHKYETAFALEQDPGNPAPLIDEHLDALRLYKALDKLPQKKRVPSY